VVLIEALLIALTITWIFSEALDRGKSYVLAIIFSIWAAAMSSIHWLPRPHLFTFLLLAIWTTGIRRVARGDKYPLWLFPILMVFWVNAHGAFISGFVVWGCYLAGSFVESQKGHGIPALPKSSKRLIIAGVLSLAATMLNPVNWRVWQTSFGYINNAYLTSHTMEYLSPDFHLAGFWPFLAMIGFIIFFFSMGQAQLSFSEGLILAFWAVTGLYSARNIPLFAVIATPILASYFATHVSKNRVIQTIEEKIGGADRQLSGYVWPLIAILMLVVFFYAEAKNRPDRLTSSYFFSPATFPVGAVDWLKLNPQDGNMFNYFTWGGYLLYRLWPEQNVFIDGQTDFYGENLTRDYEKISTPTEEWKDLLAKYDVKWLIYPTNTELMAVLRTDPDWRIVYSDSVASIAVNNLKPSGQNGSQDH
jgi:hypothetical protein